MSTRGFLFRLYQSASLRVICMFILDPLPFTLHYALLLRYTPRLFTILLYLNLIRILWDSSRERCRVAGYLNFTRFASGVRRYGYMYVHVLGVYINGNNEMDETRCPCVQKRR